MNIIEQHKDEEQRPEPFATINELIAEYGNGEVLEAIAENAEYDSQDVEACSRCREKGARLSLEIYQLLERMADFEETLDQAGEDPECHTN
jgi:hypothetical protein